MAKPDDRSDNVEKLQEKIDNTLENMREARDFLNAHDAEMAAEDKQDIISKNRRREESIEGFRAEIQDEVSDQQS